MLCIHPDHRLLIYTCLEITESIQWLRTSLWQLDAGIRLSCIHLKQCWVGWNCNSHVATSPNHSCQKLRHWSTAISCTVCMPKQYPQAILAEVQVVPCTSKYKRIDHPACLCANSTPYELHTPPLLSLLSLHMEYRHMSGCLMWIAADILLNGETVLSFGQWNQCCCTFFIIDDDVHRIPWWTCHLHSTIIHFCLPSFLASMHRSHMLETIHMSSISALIEPSLGSQTSVACPDAQHKCQVQCSLGGLVDGLLFGLAHFLINNDSDWNSILTIFILIFFLSLPPDLSPRVSMRCIHLYVQCHHQTHAAMLHAEVQVVCVSKPNRTDNVASMCRFHILMNHPHVLHYIASCAFTWSSDICCMSGCLVWMLHIGTFNRGPVNKGVSEREILQGSQLFIQQLGNPPPPPSF